VSRAPGRRGDPLADTPDDALFARMAAGDLASLGELFDRYHAIVRQVVIRWLVDPAEVDDVVQETFLAASRAAASFRAGASGRPFLIGIAANLVRRRRRSFARLRRMLEGLGQHPVESPPPTDERLAERAQHMQLHAALAKLSERHRMVLVMVEFGEMSGVEAAQALGLPPGTVWRRLSEARAELARRLGRAS